MFKKLSVLEWRQFSDVKLDFHPHLTVITGANGAGKTTLLNILARNFGWDSQFVSSYGIDKETGKLKYSNSLHKWSERIKEFFNNSKKPNTNTDVIRVGELQYSDKDIAYLELPNVVTNTYAVNINGQKQIKGIFINSHRPTFPYRTVKNIPTEVAGREQIFRKYNDFTKKFVFDTYRNAQEVSATSLIKETLASLAMFGYGNQAVSANEEAKKLFEEYVNILKIVLPPKLGFTGIEVVIPEVILHTKTGDFPIDAVSGGISSIIDITWQLFMYADPAEKFVTIIDEPENHLHPELQKSFLHNLIKAFPNVQFIVATHNPFMISAEKDSNVYVLDYDNNNKVYSQKLDYINRAGTSNSILSDVLGIDSSMPYWAEQMLADIVERFNRREIDNDSLALLRNELNEIGLDDYIPETISRIVDGDKND